MLWLRIAAMALALLGVGCAPTLLLALRDRAAYEFDCPADQLAVTQLGTFSMQGVSGCGHKGVYFLNHDNQWILNSDAEARDSKQ